MKISLNWLNDYVSVKNIEPNLLADKITKSGINIEGRESKYISGLVIGKVLKCEKHPDSDHLNVTEVDVKDEVLQIVCGASNVKKGINVIVAKSGVTLPGDFTIKKTSIRGVESNGMICALFELGLEDKESNYDKGIHIIEEDVVVGSDANKYLNLDDSVWELDLNPNRNDCLSYLGFAYQTGAVIEEEIVLPEVVSTSKSGDFIELDIQTNNCTMYRSRLVKDVVIGESPDFIKNRLLSNDIRPINNVVDISNYIMLEYGQPLHFFDYDKVGKKIIVRMPHENEVITTLDSKDRVLDETDIVIANEEGPIALAGVMGGLSTEVIDSTKNILIESAIFNPYNVRYTSIRHELRSESSLRNEKILNYEYTLLAIDRACYLLEKYASATIVDGEVTYDKVNKGIKEAVVSIDKINQVLGLSLTSADISSTLDRLGFSYNLVDGVYTVIIPNRRMDVSIAQDIIEEIGALYGYDNIVAKMPKVDIKRGEYAPNIKYRKQVSKYMRTLGFSEVRTYNLINEAESKLFDYNFSNTVSLLSPMSNDKAILRQSVLPSLLKVMDYNMARNTKDIAVYEVSNIYSKSEEYDEVMKLSFLALGTYLSSSWQGIKLEYDFYIIKSKIEQLLNYLGLEGRYVFSTSNNFPKEMHPKASASILIDNKDIGYFGLIHPAFRKEKVILGELDLTLLQTLKVRGVKYKEVSKYPSVSKDMAFIVNRDVEAGDIIKTIKKSTDKTLVDVDVFDVYEGVNIDNDKKSMAFTLLFQSTDRTLVEEEVMNNFNKAIDAVVNKYNAILRDK